MEVKSLVGSRAGTVVEMQTEDALRCVAGGSHEFVELSGRRMPDNWRRLDLESIARLASGIYGKKVEPKKAVAMIEEKMATTARALLDLSPSLRPQSPEVETLGISDETEEATA